MGKKLIFVACGAGTYTSLLASQEIEEGLKNNGITNVNIKYGRIDDLERFKDDITVLVTTMNFKKKYDFPILNGISFITGDEDGQKKLMNDLIKYLND